MLTGGDIRNSYLKFFESNGHTIVPSSSLVPTNDPTLMFTNSGMVQFKNVFTGAENKGYTRAASAQRCVRAGGKHNDLENVGRTARHHTFFEMLGNFSFGDYFKEEAITWGWTWITEHLKVDPSRLCVTVYHDDDEAFNIWNKKIGVSANDIIRIPTSDNFWTMGDTGPCGPCSEIFFDHGAHIPGGRPGTPDEDGDRFVEIWNLVFTQFDLQPDGSKIPLARKCIDTGAGLERVTAVAQGVCSNYEIDTFQKIIQTAAGMAGVEYGKDTETDVSLQVVADHLRAMSFLMIDGVMPSNEGRGYVLRRIMRRAMRHVHMLGVNKPFINNLVPTLSQVMGESYGYPELTRGAQMVADTIKIEEERFSRTLTQGLKLLEEETGGLKAGESLNGEVAFKLYDTYGFPLDLTEDALKARNIQVDAEGFETAMNEQRNRARAAGMGGTGQQKLSPMWFTMRDNLPKTEFLGYDVTTAEAAVQALVVKEGESEHEVQSLKQGQTGTLVCNQTPFYAESGGQVGDTGYIYGEHGAKLKVLDTQKVLEGHLFQHKVEVLTGEVKKGEGVRLEVDAIRRQAIRRAHTATHLVHAALRKIVGEHVFQKGSQVADDRLRFDFSHMKAVTPEELAACERWANEQVLACLPVRTRLMDKDAAVTAGAMALFGEKYDDEVRVLSIEATDAHGVTAPVSVELCGGTHATNTGQIGLIKIVVETSVAAGVRRVEALTGEAARQYLVERDEIVKTLATDLKCLAADVPARVKQLATEKSKLEKDLKQAKKASGAGGADHMAQLMAGVETVNGIPFIGAQVEDADTETLRDMAEDLKNRLQSGVVLLATANDEKSMFIAGVTADLTPKIKAGDLVNAAAAVVGGKGGGRPELAMAGGALGDLAAAVTAGRAALGA